MGLGNNTKMTSLVMVLVCCMVVVAPIAEAAVTCGLVTSKLVPCLTYLRGAAGSSPACCSAVKALSVAAVTMTDRRTACGCLKKAAGSIPGFKYSYASSIVSTCHVTVPYPISPSTDCSKIN